MTLLEVGNQYRTNLGDLMSRIQREPSSVPATASYSDTGEQQFTADGHLKCNTSETNCGNKQTVEKILFRKRLH